MEEGVADRSAFGSYVHVTLQQWCRCEDLQLCVGRLLFHCFLRLSSSFLTESIDLARLRLHDHLSST